MAIFSEDQAALYRTTLCATWPDQASDERVATPTTSPPVPWSFCHGRKVRSFVSPKHRRRIFNEIKFHPKGGRPTNRQPLCTLPFDSSPCTLPNNFSQAGRGWLSSSLNYRCTENSRSALSHPRDPNRFVLLSVLMYFVLPDVISSFPSSSLLLLPPL